MARHMQQKFVVGMAVLGGIAGISAGWYLWQAHQDQAMSAGNTRFFQWTRGEARDELLLNVQPNPQFHRYEVVSMPQAPAGGRVVIMGNPGTVAPGAFVQVRSKPGGETHTAVADEQGGFRLEMRVEAGDTPMVTAFIPPEVILSPELDWASPAKPR